MTRVSLFFLLLLVLDQASAQHPEVVDLPITIVRITEGPATWDRRPVAVTEVLAELTDTVLVKTQELLEYVPGPATPTEHGGFVSSGHWRIKTDTFSVDTLVMVRLFVEHVLPADQSENDPVVVRLYLTPDPIYLRRPRRGSR